MIANIFGGDGLIVLILAIVVLFGGSQLPKLAKNVGSAGREFRKAQAEAEEAAHAQQASLAEAPAPVAPAPVAPGPVVHRVPPVAVVAEDTVVISRSDLRHELAELLDQAHTEH